MTETRLSFFVKSEFRKGLIEARYLSLLKKYFEEILGFPVEVEITCAEASIPEKPIAEENSYSGGNLNYTFDNFIVGSSNKFAHAASWAVASNPAKAYNPLFIYGGSGLGKTHLMYAICDEVKKQHPEYKILSVKGEEFTNEMINAIQIKKSTFDFHEKYRQVDLLAVDDIQFISGKESTQEEIFHTFDSLFLAGKQIVITSDRPPKEIKTLADRLRTRFESGLLADIQPPDIETRMAILIRKFESMGVTVSDDVIEYIANTVKTDIRKLEGVAKKISLYSKSGSAITVLLARTIIKDVLTEQQPLPMTVERIINEVARTYNVSADDIRSKRQSSNISTPRQIAMYIIREVTQMSMDKIGAEFSDKDHSTVTYAIKQVEKKISNNSAFKETIDDIIKNIKSVN